MQTPPEHGVVIIHNLLRAGFGFVGSAGRVVALLGVRRCYLPLQLREIPATPRLRLQCRAKDVARRLRNTVPTGCTLALRLNTDFKRVMEGLRDHHPQNWVYIQLYMQTYMQIP